VGRLTVAGYENKIFVTAKNEKRPQMIHSLNPEQDVLPDEVMELAGAIYGGSNEYWLSPSRRL
jgi:hypothetical protein